MAPFPDMVKTVPSRLQVQSPVTPLVSAAETGRLKAAFVLKRITMMNASKKIFRFIECSSLFLIDQAEFAGELLILIYIIFCEFARCFSNFQPALAHRLRCSASKPHRKFIAQKSKIAPENSGAIFCGKIYFLFVFVFLFHKSFYFDWQTKQVDKAF